MRKPVVQLDAIVISPAGRPDAGIAIAGSRAGAIGVVDLQFSGHEDEKDVLVALTKLARLGRGRRGLLLDGARAADLLRRWPADALAGLDHVILTATEEAAFGEAVVVAKALGTRPFVLATDLEQARAGVAAGVEAVIAKGNEAGGWVGDEGSFVLAQRCLAALDVPVWVHGGVGLRTAAAAAVAGAAGVVLDSQLLLTRESPLPPAVRARIAAMDGSSVSCVGAELGAPFRFYDGAGLTMRDELAGLKDRLLHDSDDDGERRASWREMIRTSVGWEDVSTDILVVGQDGAFARELADRFCTVAGVVNGLRSAAAEHLAIVQASDPLGPQGRLAASHGTTYGIVQGPMTRVSDRAEFAAAVAEAGALPFLALALMSGDDAAELLEETRALLGERPWGVGILGFVPAELRTEQLAAIRASQPPFALIAGGRPDQARTLEDAGIATYLHVPSPALLRLYLRDGAKRFIFEGRECGGHVGPSSSFVLWDTMIGILADELPSGADASEYHVLFAGGVHDGLGGAMVAAAAAPLAAKGIGVGVLVGTAYLFTEEAVTAGAITPAFQDAAVAGDRTVLLESGPGHATRCLPSPFVDDFLEAKHQLRRDGVPADEMRYRLEDLNIGRLRIASKGVERDSRFGAEEGAPKLAAVAPDGQWARGMFMIGQVAALRDRVCTLPELHRDIAQGCAECLGTITPAPRDEEPALPPADIAIIGMSCIVPGAQDPSQFWSNILNKVDSVTEVPSTRWDWRQYFDPDRSAKDKVYSRWGGFIDDVVFDPVAFGMPPASLRSVEPFQLLALATAKAALADAGYERRPFPRERTSVILGAGGGGADLAVGYTFRSSLPLHFGDGASRVSDALGDRLPEWTEDSFPGLLMNVAAGRISNRLDLGGPNFTVDAACASALAAVGIAVRELQVGTVDVAIAGGVDAIQTPFSYLCFSKTQALSPTGRCRPFDADADGIAISEGFATVVLKRLDEAERDGDRVYAVIRGVGSASDGRDRSLTAPRPEGQMRALRRAYAHAGVSPSTVGLVEAHGTGTVAGDSAEIEALSTLFEEMGTAPQQCAIGSVKSNLGHTKAAAGVVGLMKAGLALHHRVLPPTIGVTTPNPKARFASSPFYVNSEARPWINAGDHPRRAAVSAFGFGGTNFHLVLEEYAGGFLRQDEAPFDPWPAELLLFRGETTEEIRASVDGLRLALEQGAQPALADLAFTLASRPPGAGAPLTLAIVTRTLDELAEQLPVALRVLDTPTERHHGSDGVHFAPTPLAVDGGLALVFPGQGSQQVNMARDVAIAFPEVRRQFDGADRRLAERHPQPLGRYIFPPPAFTAEERTRQQAELTETRVAQPALGATELAYLALLRALGVQADMVAGHSYGEFVALAAAGVLDDASLLSLSEARGRFIEEEAGDDAGSMAAIVADRESIQELLDDGDLVLANVNAPGQLVVSGSRASIDRATASCAVRGISAKELPVACAFHSPLVAPAKRRLAEFLADTSISAPRVPVFSNTTAARYPDEPAAIAALLAEHLVEPVEFEREIEAMHDAGARVFVEVGPRTVLTGLIGRILADRPHVAVPIDRPDRSGLVQLLDCLATLAAEGAAVDTDRLFLGRDVRPLDMSNLVDGDGSAAPPASAWFVNGGSARSLGVALEESKPIDLDDVMNDRSENAHTPSARPAHEPEPYAVDPVGPAPTPPAPAPAPIFDTAGNGDVMRQYHSVMARFLETERAVMLTYLGQPDLAHPPPVTALPIESVAVPSTRAPWPPSTNESNGHSVAVAAPATNGSGNGHAATDADAEPTTNGGSASAPAVAQGPVDVAGRLLEIVAERTGYPLEMLDVDADVEAELGIDSIKRVEIAGTMLEWLALPDGAIDTDELIAARTLRQATAVLEQSIGATATEEEPEAVPFAQRL